MPNKDTSLLRTVFLSPLTVLIRQVLLYILTGQCINVNRKDVHA